VNIVGLDPGFGSLGYAVLEVSKTIERITAAGVIRTKPTTKKNRISNGIDNVRRTREILDVLEPLFLSPVLVCTESQSWVRNASASIKIAHSWGAIITLTGRDTELRQVSPKDLKFYTTGDAAASKDDVEASVLGRWPELANLLESVAPFQRNHAYDAAGSILASINKQPELLELLSEQVQCLD
jgi:crossover junction endodeoxyribonuclease RuvC